MKFLSVAVVLGLASGLAATSSAAAPTKKGGEKQVHGVVVSVQQGKGKDGGSITVQIHHKGKKGAAATSVEKTFKVGSATTVEKVVGKKGNAKEEPGSFADVHQGAHVALTVEGGTVEKIIIHGKK